MFTVAIQQQPKQSSHSGVKKSLKSHEKIVSAYACLSCLFFKLQQSFKVTRILKFPPHQLLFTSARYCCSFGLIVDLLVTDISSRSMLLGLLWLVSTNMSEKIFNIPNALGLWTIIPHRSRQVRYDLSHTVILCYFICYVVLQVKLATTLEGGSRKQSNDKVVDKLRRLMSQHVTELPDSLERLFATAKS